MSAIQCIPISTYISVRLSPSKKRWVFSLRLKTTRDRQWKFDSTTRAPGQRRVLTLVFHASVKMAGQAELYLKLQGLEVRMEYSPLP